MTSETIPKDWKSIPAEQAHHILGSYMNWTRSDKCDLDVFIYVVNGKEFAAKILSTGQWFFDPLFLAK